MKKLISLILCLVCLLTIAPTGYAAKNNTKTLPDFQKFCGSKVTFKELKKLSDGRYTRKFTCDFSDYKTLLKYLDKLCDDHGFTTAHKGDGYTEYKNQVAFNWQLKYKGSAAIDLYGSNERANGKVSGSVTFQPSFQLFSDQKDFEAELKRKEEAKKKSSNSDSNSSYDVPNSSRNKDEKHKCVKCSGDGEVTCGNCSGRGYKESYQSTPNYSGRKSGSRTGVTKERCYKCKGSGSISCTRCGGDGKY